MAIERIGFANAFTGGSWSPIFAREAEARVHARENASAINRRRIAVPVLIDVPDVPPRPAVALGDGTRVRYHATRPQFLVGTTPYDSVVALVRAVTVTDAELDALQALPAEMAAWVANGGTDAG